MLAMHFLLKAQNSAWANMCLYKSVAGLEEAAFHTPGPLGSLSDRFRTLHEQDQLFVSALEVAGNPFMTVDGIGVLETREQLEAAQSAVDQRLIAICQDLDDDILVRLMPLPIKDPPCREAVHAVLGHLFTVQAQFRGQIQLTIQQMGRDVSTLDQFFLDNQRDPSAEPFRSMSKDLDDF